jgi:uncharacterized membrane protein
MSHAQRNGWIDLSVRVGVLGFAAGLRSQVPWAGLALSGLAPTFGPARSAGSGPRRVLTVLAAAAEIVSDKLPFTPSRVRPPALAARVVSGALVGASLASAFGRRGAGLAAPAALAGATAAAGSVAGYHARKAVTTGTSVPDPVAAVVEDGVTVGLVALAVRHAG